jgi:hypothetical protein
MRAAVLAITCTTLTACAVDADLAPDHTEATLDDSGAFELGAELGVYPAEPAETIDKVWHGDVVTGAGDRGQWEGIVELTTEIGLGCTGFFITDRHVLTAGHCFATQSTQNVELRAPTWDGGRWHSHRVWVNRRGDGRGIDVALVQFVSPVAWATPARRFRLFTGTTRDNTMLNIYGYGARGYRAGGDGQLRTGEGGSRVRLVDHGDGWFNADAREARICQGDSGGPAIREGERAIVWGIAKGGYVEGSDRCPRYEDAMQWTKVNHTVAYIEQALGFSCARFTADDQNYARCW